MSLLELAKQRESGKVGRGNPDRMPDDQTTASLDPRPVERGSPRRRLAQPGGVVARTIAEAAVFLLGFALLISAAVVDARWIDAHILPNMFAPRLRILAYLDVARPAVAVLGLLLLAVVSPIFGRYAQRTPVSDLLIDVCSVALAVLLALGASELLLRSTAWRQRHEPPPNQEPLRHRDPVLGWSIVPGHVGYGRASGGAMVQYAFDRAGYRVRRPGDAVDTGRPTILFAGESILGGHGLPWSDGIPAQVEAMTGVQSANMTVDAFANDQSYLRLKAELPRFRRPVAVVSVFVPSLFYRNLDDDRPHLDLGLTLRPPVRRWRIVELVLRGAPVRSQAEIARGVALTREIFADTRRLAQARGAQALIVVPQLTAETPAEHALRRRVLDEAGLPYVYVAPDPAWRIPDNKHPDARASRVIAQAIAGRLALRNGAPPSLSRPASPSR